MLEASRTPIIAGRKALPRFRKRYPQTSSRWIKAKGASADAQKAADQAQKSASDAKGYAAAADKSAQQAENSATKAAKAATTARNAADAADSDAAAATESAAQAEFSASYARSSASQASTYADDARLSARDAGKNADEAKTLATQAWKDVLKKRQVEQAEAQRLADQQRKQREKEQREKAKRHCRTIPDHPGNEAGGTACMRGSTDDWTIDTTPPDPTLTKIFWDASGLTDIKVCIKNPTLGQCTVAVAMVLPLGKALKGEKLAVEGVEAVVKESRAAKAANGGLGELVEVAKPDPAADALAQRLGGASRVRFANDPSGREYDAISDLYVAQSKPAGFRMGSAFRNQAKATFEASLQTGRKPYFHFEGSPDAGVIAKLQEYGQRYGVQPVIDVEPLG
ncbi:restriction endonuclease fold toxin [Streptomyces sp. NPDC051162]|uniref:restriction endonuclease fold toxin n=1 Tax=Streptomyces sp. NPDC051162 TaxID=3154747 RepID=UPI00343E179A